MKNLGQMRRGGASIKRLGAPGPPVKCLIHISDIHIRLGDRERCRYTEYFAVLGRFCETIAEMQVVKDGEALVVVTGDLFHNKGRLEATTVELYLTWMERLLTICPVVLISGNHDYRQESSEMNPYPDIAHVMSRPFRPEMATATGRHPLFYLEKTGHYVYRSLGIGTVVVSDTLKAGNTRGLADDLPIFPAASVFSSIPEVTHSVALFHGSVSDRPLPTGWVSYPMSWFATAGYTRLLLGDIHTQMVKTTACLGEDRTGAMTWAYPGSLIQQEYCEPTFGHGYLLWNLDAGANTGAVTKHHVYNEYGMVTLRRKPTDGQIVAILGARRIVAIGDAVAMDDFPQFPKIRILGKPEDREAIEGHLTRLGVTHKGIVNALPIQASEGDADMDGGGGGGAGGYDDGLDLLMEEMEEDDGDDGGGGVGGAEGGVGAGVGGAVGGAEVVGAGRLRKQQKGLAERQREVLADLNSPRRWCEYLQAVAPDLVEGSDAAGETLLSLIQTPEKMMITLSPEEVAIVSADTNGKIKERNATLAKACEEYRAYGTRPQTELFRVTLKKMYWSYAMCFSATNHFSFDDMTGQIVLLNGSNATGKSSFLDVICIGLFGEPTRNRNAAGRSITSAKMIHDSRPPNSGAMNVRIMFEMEGHGVFEIMRSFNKVVKEDRGAQLAKPVNTAVYSVVLEGEGGSGAEAVKTMVCEGTTAVDAWVARYIGTIDDILMSTIIQQVDTASFFHMKSDDQKALLDRSLRLESISVYGKLIHEAILSHVAILGRITTAIETLKEPTGGSGSAGANAAALESVQKEISELESKRADVLEKRDALIRTMAGLCGAAATATATAADAIKNPKQKLERAQARLETFSDLSEEDRTAALMIKGEMRSRWDAISLAAAEFAEMEEADDSAAPKQTKEDVVAEIAELTAARERHAREMPVAQWSDAELKANEKDIARWKKRGGDAVDPDPLTERLETLREEATEQDTVHQALLRMPMRKPVTPEPKSDQMRKKVAADAAIGEDDLNVAREKLRATTEKWSAAVKAVVNPRRPRDGLAAWETTYAEWAVDGGDGGDGDGGDGGGDGGGGDGEVAALEARVTHYADFIAAFEKKEAERQAILAELSEIAELEAQMADLPFNAECWACKKQPMRTLLDKKLIQKAERGKVLARIQRYIVKCGVDPEAEAAGGSAAYVARMRDEMRDAEEALARRRRYEDARERMESEAAVWEAAAAEWAAEDAWRAQVAKLEAAMEDWKAVVAKMEWMAWRQWSERETTTRERLEAVRNEIARDEAALAEYTAMSALLERIGDERSAREALHGWTAEGTRLETAIRNAERTGRRLDLIAQRAEVEAAISLNGEMFDRLMDWERTHEDVRMLKAAVAREDLTRVQTTLDATETKLETARETLGRVRQEETERTRRETRATVLRAIYRRLSERKDRLSRMEEKFVGGSGGDGFLEWIYKKRVIPLLEREVNRFLSLIDDFRLKIDYRAKRLLYNVLDRGNEPTLEHVSGYQRYIVGLAMRAGLSRISAVGQNLSLLCLDESFVACDAVNIQKTEMILRNIMAYSGQTHLIITSHLDTIRDAADRIVDIQRTGRFSTIAFGAVYPIIRVLKTPKATAAGAAGSVAVEDLVAASAAATPMKTVAAVAVEEVAVKKRGRPKKAVATTAPL